MTHKQQADELIKKFLPYANPNSGEANWNSAKKCALIAAESMYSLSPYPVTGQVYEYWQAVKAEIEKL